MPLRNTYNSKNEFSSETGTWRYLFAENNTFSAMSWDENTKMWSKTGRYCSVGAARMHPDENIDAVRTWVSTETGFIVISNTVKKLDVTGGDGVLLKIMKNGTQIWPESGWCVLDYDDAQGKEFEVPIEVASGDNIHFIVNANQSSNYDTTFWVSNIKFANKEN